MRRTFHPVGQGAFSSETFFGEENAKHVIFDCGTSTSGPFLENAVSNLFRRDFSSNSRPQVPYFFISHLHEDHINGIPYLSKRVNIEKIFLPLTHDSAEVYLKVHKILSHAEIVSLDELNSIEGYANVLSNGMHEMIYSDSGIIQVAPVGMEGERSDSEVNSGEEITIYGGPNNNKWKFIPFNLENESRVNQFWEEINESTDEDIKSIFDINRRVKVGNLYRENVRQKLRKIYSSIEGGIHSNMLVVFSMPCRHHWKYFIMPNVLFALDKYEMNPGCVYFGDAMLKGKMLDQIKKAVTPKNPNTSDVPELARIGTVQIPHHGANGYFTQEIFEIFPQATEYVVSAGGNNPYCHPSESVTSMFYMESRRKLWCINEYSMPLSYETFIRH